MHLGDLANGAALDEFDDATVVRSAMDLGADLCDPLLLARQLGDLANLAD